MIGLSTHGTRVAIRTARNIIIPKRPQSRRCFSTSQTTVHRGRRFELQTKRALNGICMRLSHVGAAHDMGVDLRGDWCVGDLSSSVFVKPHEPTVESVRGPVVPVIVQCKAEKKEIGPRTVRELQGTLATMEAPGTLAVLSSSRGFTSAATEQFMRSPSPLILLTLEVETDQNEDVPSEDYESAPVLMRLFKLNPVARSLVPNVMVVRAPANRGGGLTVMLKPS